MSHSMFKSFAQFCSEFDLNFQTLGEGDFMGSFAGRSGRWTLFVRVIDTLFIATSFCPLTVPEARRTAVLDYLNRANRQMAVGNFEMDPSSGEVSLRTSVNSADEPLAAKVLGMVLLHNLYAFDHYLPGLLVVALGKNSPDEAIAALDALEQEPESSEDDLAALLRDLDLDRLAGPDGDD